MDNKKLHYNELAENIYKKVFTIKKLVIFSILLVVFGFLNNYPFDEIINNRVESLLKKNGFCSLRYEKVETSLLLLKIDLKKPVIPGSCVGSTSSIPLDKLTLSFRGPSFSPLGVKLLARVKAKESKADIYISASNMQQLIKIENSRIGPTLLAPILNNNQVIDGNFNVETLITLQRNKLQSLDAFITSKDLVIPPQKVSIMALPRMNIGTLSLKTTIDGKKNINIKQLNMGNTKSPINITASGNIAYNEANKMSSTLDLQVELSLSEQFADLLAFIPNYIEAQGVEKVNGVYPMQITGRLFPPPVIKSLR